jgi:hypothetical protein
MTKAHIVTELKENEKVQIYSHKFFKRREVCGENAEL